MTRMIPAIIDPSVQSAAERRLFAVIENASETSDWVCLHSLGLARHPTKRRGEIDFLLLTRKGVFVLEVKGGRIQRRDGVWIHTDRFGNEATRRESPFDQASSAMFGLESRIRQAFPSDERIGNLLNGYGVMLPDVVFDDLGTEGDRLIVYDARDRQMPITSFVERLATFARERSPRARYAPTTADIEKLVKFLRGDFDLVPPLNVLADEAAERLLRLTEEQYAVLDALVTVPRLLVQGGAGTGKTLLAAESARRESQCSGRRVLLLCYNRLLAAFLDAHLRRTCGKTAVTVRSVYAWFNELVERSPLAAEFRARRDAEPADVFYRRTCTEYALMALLEGAPEQFDVVMIDEAQDMMTDAVLDVIDACVRGGLEGGRWQVFCDANNQGAIYGVFEENALARLRRFGSMTVLSMNRRNTRQIADETTMLASPRMPSVGVVSGLPVEYAWYEKTDDQLDRLRRVLKRLNRQGVEAGRVTVLSPRNLHDCCAAALEELVPVTEQNVTDVVRGAFRSTTRSTVSAFKGLENDFIILTDIDNIEGEWWKSVVYVGMSRARVGLSVLLNQELQITYESCFARWLERTSAENSSVSKEA